MKHISKYLHNLKKVTNDPNPNLISCGDYNIWHEMIGSDGKKRDIYKNKFKNGDYAIKSFHDHGLININDGTPTFWKENNGIKKHYHIDSVWINNNFNTNSNVSSTFNQDIDISDHYYNDIKISIDVERKQIKHQYVWKINQMTDIKWKAYEESLETEINDLISYGNDHWDNNNNDPNKYLLDFVVNYFQNLMIKNAIKYVGRKKIRINRISIIDEELKCIIDEVRNFRKEIKHILLLNKINQKRSFNKDMIP